MKRSKILSFNSVQHIKYIPSIINKIKNWASFIFNYTTLKDSNVTYVLRNGLKINTHSPLDAATIMVVFIKKEYGEIPDDDIIVDVGANIGCFALYAVSNSKNARVFAYEPEKNNFELLEKNINTNKMKNSISAFNLAVCGSTGKRKLYLSESPYHTLYENQKNQKFSEVNCISLEDVFTQNNLGRIDLLKLDCEGAEFEILYGAPDNRLNQIKEIKMEYHNNNDNNIADLKKFLENKGFKTNLFSKETGNSGIIWLENKNRI